MKKKLKNKELWLLGMLAIAVLLFFVLYQNEKIPIEEPISTSDSELEKWTLDDSTADGLPISEDKGIYPDEPDCSINDVYLSVFPTKDETGSSYRYRYLKCNNPCQGKFIQR